MSDPRTPKLPPGLTPRMLNREAAAEYCGISPPKFDQLVALGTLPRAVRFGRRRCWDVRNLDLSLDKLSGIDTTANPDVWSKEDDE